MALQRIDQKISDVTDICCDALVDQRALLARQAADQNIDLQPYREKILREMAKKKKRKAAEIAFRTKPRAPVPVMQNRLPNQGDYFPV